MEGLATCGKRSDSKFKCIEEEKKKTIVALKIDFVSYRCRTPPVIFWVPGMLSAWYCEDRVGNNCAPAVR